MGEKSSSAGELSVVFSNFSSTSPPAMAPGAPQTSKASSRSPKVRTLFQENIPNSSVFLQGKCVESCSCFDLTNFRGKKQARDCMRIEQMEYSCFQFCGCGDGISYALILKSEVSMLDLTEEEGGFIGKAAVIFATAMYL